MLSRASEVSSILGWRKITAASLLVLALLAPGTVMAADEELDPGQTLALILDAAGGETAWREMKSLRVSGTMGVAGELERAPFSIEWRRPMAVRLQLERQTGVITQAFDGDRGWARMPGSSDVIELSGVQVRQLVQQTDLVGPLLRLAISGSSGDNAVVTQSGSPGLIRVSHVDEVGNQFESLVDAKSHLELRRDWTGLVRGQPTPMRSVFRKHRQSHGLSLATWVEIKNLNSGSVSTIEIDRIEFDALLPDELFVMPAEQSRAAAGSDSSDVKTED